MESIEELAEITNKDHQELSTVMCFPASRRDKISTYFYNSDYWHLS